MSALEKLQVVASGDLKYRPNEVYERVISDEEHIVLTRGGLPLAVLLPVPHYKRLIEASNSSKTENQ